MTEEQFQRLEEVYQRAKKIHYRLECLKIAATALDEFEDSTEQTDIPVNVGISWANGHKQTPFKSIFDASEIIGILRASFARKIAVYNEELNALKT